MPTENTSSLENSSPTSHVRKHIPVRFYFIVFIVFWTAAAAASLWYNLTQIYTHAEDSARIQARTAFEKDVTYRRWNSAHGGVYAPVNDKTVPNPYLSPKDREISGPGDTVLTKINPAYMTRLVHEIGELSSGVRGHITSNKPIRPQNEPDPWESKGLVRLENKETDEVTELQEIDGKPYMRLIRGLTTEESCMPCHRHQGYTVGDVRGGISVSVPMEPFIAGADEARNILFGSHAGLWLLGVIGITLGARRLEQGIRDQQQAEEDLRQLTEELEARVEERTGDLRSRQRELQAFLDNANAGVYLKTVNGEYHIVNSRFADILDRPLERIRGKTNDDLLSKKDAAVIKEYEQWVIDNAQSKEFKEAFTTRDGHKNSCFMFPVLEEREVVGLGGIIVDMSERDAYEDALRETKDAAERASRAKSDFLANMSHEIRTPLNGVIGMADLLLRTRMSPDQASMAAAIKTSGDSLLVVLNDILDISKIEAGKMALEQAPFLLRDVLFNAVKGLTPIAYKKQLELILHVSPQVPDHVIGDPVRLRQVLLNLVNNALKFTEKGEVVVTALLVDSNEETARLRFSVTDTGIGIPKEKLETIFHAFEQADTSTTRKYGGTGLGLAICSRLVKLMNSTLEVKSHEGFGSSFWFELELPLAQGEAPPKPLMSSDALRGYHVLIVDDNDTNLLILSETVGAWGMVVEQCSSVDEALARCHQTIDSPHPFSLILSDLQMPDKDGVDLLKAVRADPRMENLPVILLTSGNLPVELQSKTGQPGFFHAVLDKPVRPDVLMRSIASSLNIWESYDAEDLQRANEQEAQKTSSRTLDILLVEDVEMNQMVATRMLKELGHTITVVGDGQQAVEAILHKKFDLVFMDIQMPVMDGVQATRTIRDMERQGQIQHKTCIIAMTANALKDDREKYLAEGMDGYLSKPLLTEDIRQVIDDMILSKEEKPAEDKNNEGSDDNKEADVKVSASVPLSQEENKNKADNIVTGIDWKHANRSFADSKEFLTESIKLYLRDAPNLLQETLMAIERQDNAGLTVNAHALKGITSYFTRAGAFTHAQELEEIGRDNAIVDKKEIVERIYASLRREVHELFAEMEEYIQKNET